MMYTPTDKRNQYWNHFVASAFTEGELPHGVTGPRLRRIKSRFMDDMNVWDDVVWRHAGDERSPELMASIEPKLYEHCKGNFWGMIVQDMVIHGLL